VEAGNERQLLHRQLLGRLLVIAAVTALDLCRAAEMLRPSEPNMSTCKHLQISNSINRQQLSTCLTVIKINPIINQ